MKNKSFYIFTKYVLPTFRVIDTLQSSVMTFDGLRSLFLLLGVGVNSGVYIFVHK